MILQHINSNTVLSHHDAQNGLVSTVLVIEDGSNGNLTTEVKINMLSEVDPLAYYFALDAMPIIEERIKFKALATVAGQPIKSLREWLRAVESGEWGCPVDGPL